MRVKNYCALLMLALTLGACNSERRQAEAGQYYSEVNAVVGPYTNGVSTLTLGIGKLVEPHFAATNSLKLESADSVELVRLFDDFETLTQETQAAIKKLRPFEELDLKDSALEFVHTSSQAISGTMKQMIITSQDLSREQSHAEVVSANKEVKQRLEDANKKYDKAQLDFLKHFGIPVKN